MTENRALWELVDAKFRSGNSIPVERIVITRAEYEAILERPVVVGDEDVERAWSVLDDALNGKLDGNEYAYGDPFPMRAALESMVRGKS